MEPSETDAAPLSRRVMTDDQLSRLGVELVLAMMASATTERISPVDWWPRAKSALLAAVARGKTWGEIVTTMAAKLQIETLRLESGRAICSMAIGTADLLAFRRVAQAEAVYLVAEAAAIREHDRAAEAARREAGR